MTERLFLDRFHSGNEYKAYEFFGCHRISESKFVFRVWAPHAKSVRLVGSFSDYRECLMYPLSDGECFEIEVSAEPGDEYFYRIETFDNRFIDKADPYAFASCVPQSFHSRICLPPSADAAESVVQKGERPVNIYEVNLLSWKRHGDNSYYSYEELEKELVPYVSEMGYTHVEFMPVTEFPYDGSWGYQVTGYFSVTSRLGSPESFKSLVNAFHSAGIKVILDWVPAHFPKDEWGLYEFDGRPLYECPLWEQMEHSGWGTRKFDFGRAEVQSFLLSSAAFFIERYSVDGLRVDAVASILYLDYDKKWGEWTPNKFGDNRNLEAIDFIRKFNSVIKRAYPSAITIAEESTTYGGVTKAVEEGGLGFDYKWNMGWMNDTLFYCRQDPYFRNHHHGKITFSMMYAFSEKFILPLSHDEVVHVKGSIVNKMPGEYADKFAGERILLGYMYAHPGKKLNFMGYEFAQFSEWDYRRGIEFDLKQYELHAKMTEYVKSLNFFYASTPSLYEIENDWKGFEWLVVDDKFNNLLAFNRYSSNGDTLTAVINFSGADLKAYTFGTPKGVYRLVFNSDEKIYGGAGKIRRKVFKTVKQPSHGKDYSLIMDIPKLTCMYLIKQK